jgi:hypothetical protein
MEARLDRKRRAVEQEPERLFPPRLALHQQFVAVIPHRFNPYRVVRAVEALKLYCEAGRIHEAEADGVDER